MREIDVCHLGRPRVICCYQLAEVIVDPGPESTVERLLAELGDEVPTRILLTHIHLDHAGATGALVRRWPEVEVWVHERGAPHLIDPSRLIDSARRLYGDDLERLWGEIIPVPEANLHVLGGGEQVGPWRVAYTPGHASHHVSYLHEPTGTAFVGDVGGVRIGSSNVLPPTPPPDIDVDAWHDSLDRVAGWAPRQLALTHFGAFEDVDRQLAAMHDGLDHWSALAHTSGPDDYQAALRAEYARAGDRTIMEAFEAAMIPEQQWLGLDRYWRKRNG